MTKEDALLVIDNHKNKLLDPVEMLHWTWLRVIIANIPDGEWDAALEHAAETLSH